MSYVIYVEHLISELIHSTVANGPILNPPENVEKLKVFREYKMRILNSNRLFASA